MGCSVVVIRTTRVLCDRSRSQLQLTCSGERAAPGHQEALHRLWWTGGLPASAHACALGGWARMHAPARACCRAQCAAVGVWVSDGNCGLDARRCQRAACTWRRRGLCAVCGGPWRRRLRGGCRMRMERAATTPCALGQTAASHATHRVRTAHPLRNAPVVCARWFPGVKLL